MTLSSAQRTRIEQLKSSGLLPSPRGPALAVVQLTRLDNVSFSQLAQAVKADPALVARLLRLANACRAPGSRTIVAIQDAFGVLGLTAVRGLALGFSLLNDNQSGACNNFDYPAFWSGCLARATAMQSLADLVRIMPRDEAFTLGLLAHMGELGLASALPDEYSTLLATPAANGETRMAQEHRLFGFDHADLTAILLEDWGMHAALVEPVRCHEKPETASFVAGSRAERILFVLMLASRITDICLASETHRRSLMAEYFLLGGKLSISPEILTDLSDRIVRDWADWCRLLEVPEQALPPFAELMKASQAPAFVDFDDVHPASEGDRFRVLVVEDERSMRGLLKALLDHIGHDCIEAENGRQGYELAIRERPQLMIIDWAMPEMNGLELIRALRNTEVGRGIYILILTGMDQEENLVEAFAAGADDFLGKPLKPKVLAARLRAGQRVVTLHREIEHDHTHLKRFASEFADLNQRLQETQRTDLLTGLPARLPALAWLRQLCDSSNDQDRLGVILIQLDHLGQINRAHGRKLGDDLLRRVASLIQTVLGPGDRLARYSGASFLLICPVIVDGYLDSLVVKISKALSMATIKFGDVDVRSPISIGTATGQAVSSQIDTLLNAAELVLMDAASQ